MEAVIHTFYEALREGKVLGKKCSKCGKIAFPPRGLCARCGSANYEWIEMSGKGRILFASAGSSNFFGGPPFLLATVELEEGPLTPGVLYDDTFDFSDPESILAYNSTEAPMDVTMIIMKNPVGGEMVAFKRA